MVLLSDLALIVHQVKVLLGAALQQQSSAASVHTDLFSWRLTAYTFPFSFLNLCRAWQQQKTSRRSRQEEDKEEKQLQRLEQRQEQLAEGGLSLQASSQLPLKDLTGVAIHSTLHSMLVVIAEQTAKPRKTVATITTIVMNYLC